MNEKILLVILLLYIVPFLVGTGINRILKQVGSITQNFLVGNIFIWALFQLITVPLVLQKESFLVVVNIVNVVTIGIIIITLLDEFIRLKCKHLRPSYWWDKLSKIKGEEWFGLVVVFGLLGWMLYKIITMQHTDADDSRFVVNAADIVRTNRMFLTDPSTGLAVEHWFGELCKDVTSPWAVYIAYYAKLTDIKAVIMAHSVLPVSLILTGVSVFWAFGKEVFCKNKESYELTNRTIFMSIVLLIHIYGYVSWFNAETFMLTRIWQGKSVVASVAIPAMFLFCMKLYDEEKNWRNYILALLLNVGMCLMSGMGIIIGAIMLGCLGLVYGIAKKKVWMSLVMWLMCVPNALYYLINMMQEA